MRERSQPPAAWARYLGAAALVAVGVDHLEQFSVDHYSATIGTLFALNFASASLVACGLVAPAQRLRGRGDESRCRCCACAGLA